MKHFLHYGVWNKLPNFSFEFLFDSQYWFLNISNKESLFFLQRRNTTGIASLSYRYLGIRGENSNIIHFLKRFWASLTFQGEAQASTTTTVSEWNVLKVTWKYGIENICFKKYHPPVNSELWDSTSSHVNIQITTQTYAPPYTYASHLFSVVSPTEVETVVLHLVCVTTSPIRTVVLMNLYFSLTLEGVPSNLSVCLSPGISTELITGDNFPRCAKGSYSDEKSVCWEERAWSRNNSSP